MDKEALVYAILDAEAIKSAQSPIERPAKKRGRPAKKEAPNLETKPTDEPVSNEMNQEEKPAQVKETNNTNELKITCFNLNLFKTNFNMYFHLLPFKFIY